MARASARAGGAPGAAPRAKVFVDRLATASDVTRLLGEVDARTVSQILAVAPTRDELDEALRAVDDERGSSEDPRTPSSARVASVREVLARVRARAR